MSKKDLIASELEQVPDRLLDEVLDFVRFIKAKEAAPTFETAFLSEAALAKDWLTSEESEAWRDL